MDFSKIKNLIKSSGDKFIVLGESGEPDLVILSFAEYEKLLSGERQNGLVWGGERRRNDGEEPELVDFEPFSMKEPVGLPMRLEDIRLEDLPI